MAVIALALRYRNTLGATFHLKKLQVILFYPSCIRPRFDDTDLLIALRAISYPISNPKLVLLSQNTRSTVVLRGRI